MIKKVLVALDGSAYSRSATDHALWLAKKFSAKLSAVYVVDVVALEGPLLHDIAGAVGFEPYLSLSSKMKESLEAIGKGILKSFEEEAKAAGVLFETHLASGIVSTEIAALAKLSDVVVVGRRGVNAKFEYGMLGSVAEGVVRKSSVPVCVVPEKFSAPQNPLLCYDGSDNSAKALHLAAEFSKVTGIGLSVVTIGEGDLADGALKDAEDYLKPYNVKASFARLSGEPANAIEDACEAKKYDLIFMGAARHSKVVSLVLGGTAEYVLRAVKGPFFLAR